MLPGLKMAFEMIKQTLSNNIQVRNVHMYGMYICKYHTIMLVCMVVYITATETTKLPYYQSYFRYEHQTQSGCRTKNDKKRE